MRKSYNTPEIDIYNYADIEEVSTSIPTDNGGNVPDVPPMPFSED